MTTKKRKMTTKNKKHLNKTVSSSESPRSPVKVSSSTIVGKRSESSQESSQSTFHKLRTYEGEREE